MRVLVTGGAGFIGSHIVEHFQGSAEVVVFDNFSTGKQDNLKDFNCKIVQGDVTDYKSVDAAMKGCDYVFHLAAFVSVPDSLLHPDKCFAVNVGGTENVLKSALKNKVKKLVFSSSCAVYGDSPLLPKKETMTPDPKSPYAESKLKAEQLCAEYNKKGVKTCCLRFFNVYGPRQDPKSQYAAAIPIFIDRALKNQPMTIFGDGKQTRDFIFVKDVVQACMLASEKLEGIFNVGSGKEISIIRLTKDVVMLAGSKSKIEFAAPREGDILRSYGDISKLNKEGFVPKYDFENGLKQTVEWLRK